MDFIFRWAEEFLKKHKRIARYRRVFAVIAAVVVFATTYELILPAITMDRGRAAETPGIEIGAAVDAGEEEVSSGAKAGAEEEEKDDQSASGKEEEEEPAPEKEEEVEPAHEEEEKEEPAPEKEEKEEKEEKAEEKDASQNSSDSSDQGEESARKEEDQDKSGADDAKDADSSKADDSSGNNENHDPADDSEAGKDHDADTDEDSHKDDSRSDDSRTGDTGSGSSDSQQADNENENSGTAQTDNDNETENRDDGVTGSTSETASDGAADGATDDAAAASTEDQPAVHEPVIEYPATIVFEGKDYTITATFDEKAKLPADVKLDVVEILPDVVYRDENGEPLYPTYEEYYEKTLKALEKEKRLEEDKTVSTARFFDINFLDSEGHTVEPAAPVSIAVKYKDALSAVDTADTMAVHFDEKKDKTEVIDTQTEVRKKEIEEISFEAEKFSVYGVIGTEILEKTVLSSDGSNYKVTVTYGADAFIPEGAALEVTEITSDAETYGEYVAKTEQALGWEEGGSDYIRLFDIRIVDKDGQKVEIKAPVNVEIKLADKEDSENTQVVHFANEGEDSSVADGVAVDGVMTDGESVCFEAEGFSVYAVTEPKLTAAFLTADGRTLNVTVTFDKNEPLPSDAVLEVRELLQEDNEKEWGDRFQRLSNVLYTNYGNGTIGENRFLSISVNAGGQEYTPTYPVQVKISYDEAIYEKDDHIITVHFPDDEDRKEDEEDPVDETKIDDAEILKVENTLVEDAVTETIFETAGFSDYDLTSYGKAEAEDFDTDDQEPVSVPSESSQIEKAPILKAAGTRAAGNVPPHAKGIESNGDGTYTLDLNVTGDANTTVEEAGNVNVVIVYDHSSSMNTNVSGSGSTRADQAEDVVYDFVHSLFSYQSATHPDNIQVSLVRFARTADSTTDWTSTESTITQYFDDGGTDGSTRQNYSQWNNSNNGTNWQSALGAAQTLLDNADPDPTFVIFVTDGAPTASGDGSNAINPSGATLNQLRPFYQAARANARAIQNRDNTTLYGIYCYGTEADLLDDLIYYSNTGSDRPNYNGNTVETENYFNAGNTALLSQAIDEIFQQIVQALGITAVQISDGTTNQVTTTSGEISKLLEVDETSYKYWISIPYVNNSFQRVDLVSGNTVTYNLRNNGNGTVTVTWGTDNSVTLTGTMSNGVFKYQWTEANSLYNYNPPAAQMTNGTVDWNLSTVGTLLDGVTYTVTFECYPSQYTLDLIADLKNDPSLYNSLDSEIKKYLQPSGSDYVLSTNTNATLTYTDTRTENGPQTTEYDNPPPVGTAATKIVSLSKDWSNSIDDREKPDSLTMHVTRDGENKYVLTLDDENHWEDTAFISFGIMTVHNGNISIKASGHDFAFTEPPDMEYHWELKAPTLRPMLINTVPTMLVKIEEDEAPAMSGNNATTTEGGVTYYKLTTDGETEYYKVDSSSTSANLHATNHRRSYLDVKKTVTGGNAPADDKFEFSMKVDNSHFDHEDSVASNLDSDYWVWFSVVDGDGETVISDTLVSLASGSDGEVHRAVDSSDAYTGYYYMKSGSTITVQMQKDYNLRFMNLPTESSYTISENSLPGDSYTFVSIEGEKSNSDTGDEDTGTVTGQSITGTIDQADSTYTVTVTNKYYSIDVQLEKDDDEGNPLSGAVFDLTRYSNGAWEAVQEGIAPGGTIPEEDASDSDTDEPSEPEDGDASEGETSGTYGNPLDLGGLGIGRYRITEVHSPEGYVITNKNVYFEIHKDNDGKLLARLTDSSGNVIESLPGVTLTKTSDGDPATYLMKIQNNPGERLPMTGGTGRPPYALGGIILMMASALMYNFGMRRGERRLK